MNLIDSILIVKRRAIAECCVSGDMYSQLGEE